MEDKFSLALIVVTYHFGIGFAFIAAGLSNSLNMFLSSLAIIGALMEVSPFRGIIALIAQLCFYCSLGLMTFATASTITYSVALFATAFAIPILGERVGKVRWLAVVRGFLGVILILQPGQDAFSIY